MYRVQWVCTGHSGYVQGTVGMYRVCWVCKGYSGYVEGTVGMYRVCWVCKGYSGYVEGIMAPQLPSPSERARRVCTVMMLANSLAVNRDWVLYPF